MSIEQQYPTRTWGIKWVLRNGGLLLYSPYSFQMFTLNNTAASIWLQSDGRRAAAEIVGRILGALVQQSVTNLDEDQISVELYESISGLEEKGLIVLLSSMADRDPDELKLLPSVFGAPRTLPATWGTRETEMGQ